MATSSGIVFGGTSVICTAKVMGEEWEGPGIIVVDTVVSVQIAADFGVCLFGFWFLRKRHLVREGK